MSNLFPKEFLGDIRTIQKAHDNRQLVIFAGAGISKNSGIPLWNELSAELKKELNSSSETDDLKLAQLFYNQRKEKEYNERIRTILKYNQTIWNPLHKAILDLKPEHIITTNYDNLFEQAIDNEALSYSIVKKDQDLPYAFNTNLLIKMHGDFNELNMVLKEDDYLDYNKNFPLIESFIKGIFSSKLVLFIGFSFTDINLKFILQRVRNVLGNHSQFAYLLTDRQFSDDEKKYLELKGIKLVVYHDQIEEYFNKNNIFIGAKIPNSEIGKKVYKLIKFIEKYNDFEASQEEKHILDQLNNSLQRFDELLYLPSTFYTKIFPFSSINNSGRLTNANWLNSGNEAISKFIELIQEDNKIVLPIKEEILQKAKLENVTNPNVKLESVLYRLNISKVFFLNNTLIYNLKHEKECNCLRCSYFSLDFNRVYKDIDQEGVGLPNASEFQSDLIKAYIYCHIYSFEKAYLIYRDLANKSWRAGQYLTYFLSKLNSYWMRYFLKLNKNKDPKSYQIFRELEEIDLDRILNSLPVDSDTRHLMISIKENRHFDDLSKEINVIVVEIREKYEAFRQGGGIIGGRSVKELEIAIEKLQSYFFLNSIFYEVFEDFKILVEVAFEGLIISLVTDKKCRDKIDELELAFLQLVILHCNSEKINKILYKYKVENIKLREKDESKNIQNKFVNICINFFDSLYKNLAFGVEESDFVKSITNKEIFLKFRIDNIFNNIIQFLGFVEISPEFSDSIIDPFLKIINLKSGAWQPNVNIADKFFKRWLPFFKEGQVEQLIKITLLPKYQNHSDLINNICGNVKECSLFRVNNIKFYNDIIEITAKKESWELNFIMYYWVLGEDLKLSAANYLTESLSKKFNPKLFVFSVSIYKILPYNLFYEKYLNLVLPIEVTLNKDEEDIFGNTENVFCDSDVDMFLAFIFHEKIKLSQKDNTIISKKSPYYDWLLNYSSFDYSKFDFDWFEHYLVIECIKQMDKCSKVKELLNAYLKQCNYENKRLLTIYMDYFV